ncbi:hypothetical protein HT031_000535 [Scenedesmus sp. PABB004]|nr:hypothetical protein HT031_000535 [Scenedesmus sp. PABB004]
MEGARMQMQGALLKRNRAHRKANLLGSQYKRRWVELTADTLAYAASAAELRGGGRVAVFSVSELIWVRAEGGAKFQRSALRRAERGGAPVQVKFPERAITFKAEAGGDECDRWVAALEAARALKAQLHRSSGDKLEQLKRTAEERLLNPAPLASGGGIAAFRSAAGSAAASPRSRASSAGAAPPLSALSASAHGAEAGQRPPSPRSLLASARAGAAFVGSGAGGGACSPRPPPPSPPPGGAARRDSTSSDSGSDDDRGGSEDEGDAWDARSPAVKRAAAPAGACVGSLARSSLELQRSAGASQRSTCSSPLPPAVAVAASGADGAADARRDAHQHLGAPTPDGSAALPQLTAGAAAPWPAVAASPRGAPPVLGAAQRGAARPGSALCDDDDALCDEILRLDPADLLPPPGAAQRLACSQGRPESAPANAARPGTPLKSCLRGGSAGGAHPGSMSSPSSGSAALAAAAAAAAADLRGSPLRRGSVEVGAGGTGRQARERLRGDSSAPGSAGSSRASLAGGSPAAVKNERHPAALAASAQARRSWLGEGLDGDD